MKTKKDLQIRIAKIVLKAYTSGNFEELFPLMTKDYEHSSLWVLESLKGREAAINYYTQKGKAIQKSLPKGYLVKIINYPFSNEFEENIAVLLKQETKDKGNKILVVPTITSDGLLKSIWITEPSLFHFEILENDNTNLHFNSKKWLEKYNCLVDRIKQGDYEARKLLADEQIKIFEQTISVAKAGCYISENGLEIKINNSEKLIKNSRFYYEEFNVEDIPFIDGTTEISVKNQDSFDCAEQLLEQRFNPIVLNMANRNNPGGGVTRGCSAQEETLFRRSNLFLSLYQFADYASAYGLQKSKYQYPMNRNFGGIYSPNVSVFRKGPFGGYAFLDKPFEVAVVSVAGINRPETIDNRLTEPMIERTKNKIRTILRIGLKNNHDSIVLGALGCGAFRNPPEHIAEIFEEVINESEFKNKYKKICFAILEDHNSNKSHNKKGNFKPFYERFEKKI